MGKKPLKIIHIDTGREWRGGQQQVFYLHEGLCRRRIRSELWAPIDSPLVAQCRLNGLPYREFQYRGETDLILARQIARYSRYYGVSILHLHTGHAVTIGLLAKLFYPTLKLIASRRVDFSIQRNRISFYKYRSDRLDRIVCISRTIQDVLMKDGIPEEKLITIYSGIDRHRFDTEIPDTELAERIGWQAGGLIIGTIAALTGHKDYPTLIRAARFVIDQVPETRFIAMGEGAERPVIEKMIVQLGLQRSFFLLGHVVQPGSILKCLDIFALSSKKEGLGTAVLDALALGLPVVACRGGGIPEMITHDENGCLTPAQNPRKLAEALLELIRNPKKRQKISGNARSSTEKFDISTTIENNLQLYRQLLSTKT